MTDQSSSSQPTGQNNAQAKWNTPIGMLHSRTQDLQDYVLVGKNADGSTAIFSSGDDSTARKLLQNSGFSQDRQGERVGS